LHKIGHIGDVHIEKNKSIVSIVGEGIRENPEVIWQIIKMLTESGIHLELISQVASQISFMFIIDERHIEKTVKLLHDQFISDE
jgi:aspartate kinase